MRHGDGEASYREREMVHAIASADEVMVRDDWGDSQHEYMHRKCIDRAACIAATGGTVCRVHVHRSGVSASSTTRGADGPAACA